METGLIEGAAAIDRVLHFTIPARDARGRVVRMGPVLDLVQSAHDYPPVIAALLAEALVLVVLMGSLLKDRDSQLTMQAQSDAGPKGGIIDLLVCDYRNGELRGYVRHDAQKLAACPALPTLEALFGKAYLAITFDLAATGQRYQGIVPLEGESLAQACQAYFVQSEQVPTLIRVATGHEGGTCVAGGLLVQHLPEGEQGRERLHVQLDHPHWEHVAALAGSTRASELVDSALPLDTLVWRLFHEEEEVRLAQDDALRRGCRCDAAYYRSVLGKFPESELAEMRDADGVIPVDCAFCSKVFPIVL